jgi:uncharacterized membrane protein YczE
VSINLLAALRPSPTIPTLPWSAHGTLWKPRASTFVILLAGLWVFGAGEGALIAAGIGTAPWTVLAQGVARHTPLDVGGATIAISAVVLLGWIPLRQRVGLGTIANLFVIAISLDVMSRVLPHPDAWGWKLGEALAGILMVGIGGALYLSCNLGPGPRDGWMTGIHSKTGVGIATVRTVMELVVLLGGIVLGGHAGLGTALFALGVGYTLAASLRVLVRLTGPVATRTAGLPAR